MAIPKPPVNNTTVNTSGTIPIVPASNMTQPPRADFERNRYDVIIAQKGVDVIVEKALQCPCKTASMNALPTCRNCGGTGWLFVNPRRTRMVLQHMGIKNVEEIWSRLVHGLVTISYIPEEELGFMDRITRLNLDSVFSEVVTFKEVNGKTYGFLSYPPKSIEYIGLFLNDTDKLQQISMQNVLIDDRRIELINVDLSNVESDIITATIRYIHAPTVNVIEVQREPIDNFKWNGRGEVLQELPGKAIGRRTHDLDDFTKLKQGKLNDNSYSENNNCTNSNVFTPPCQPNL